MVTGGCRAGQGVGRRGLCRAREFTACLTLSTSHSPTVVPEWVLPASVCSRLGRIIYLGKEQSGASSKPEVQKGLQYPDSVTSSWRTA